jgi:hypothetical protein
VPSPVRSFHFLIFCLARSGTDAHTASLFRAVVTERVPGAERPRAPTGGTEGFGVLGARSHFRMGIFEWDRGLRELVALPKRGRKKPEKKN